MRFRFLRLSLLVVFIANFSHLTAQVSELQLNKLFTEQDYWALNEQYPLLKKNVSEPFQLYAEALLNHFFNKPEQSYNNIKQLLTNYSDWLPAENQVYLSLLAATNAINMQDYAKAASIYAQYIEQTETGLDSSNISQWKNTLKMYASLENVPPMSVIYEKKQTKIQLSKDTFGLLTLPVCAGKEKTNTLNFTLDFGANFSMIEEKYVDDFNIQVLSDSILISNIHGSFDYGKIGVAQEIYLDNILIKNVIFFIAPNRIVDLYPENEMNAILGLPVLQALGNLEISNSDLLISSSSKQNKSQPNMLISGLYLFVQSKSSNQKLCMLFDSGGKISILNKNYLSKSQADTNSFIADTISMAGWGGIQKMKILKVPNFRCKIGNKTLHFPLMYIGMADYFSNSSIPIDGVLGLDILLQYKKIIIDFKNMYFQIK